jgi:hypothetical protein
VLDASADSGLDAAQQPDAGTDASTVDTGFPYSPSNFDPSQIGDGTQGIDITRACTLQTTDPVRFGSGCGSPPTPNVFMQNNSGVETVIVVASSFHVGSMGTLTISGARPAIFVVTGDVQIDSGGKIFASAIGVSGGPGGGQSPSCTTGGGGAAQGGSGAGGGGGASGGAGGGGGTAGRGTNGAGGGSASGPGSLIPLTGGCPGGMGSDAQSTGGGAGGGVQISASGMINIDGIISAAGGGGLGGNPKSGAGGGGSGGSILLEAATINLNAQSALLLTNGGGGGEGGDDNAVGLAGNNGVDGHNTDTNPAHGGTMGTFNGGNGGQGGAGSAASGPGDPGGTSSSGGSGGGGGGGGNGRIRLHAPPGSCSFDPASFSGAFQRDC